MSTGHELLAIPDRIVVPVDGSAQSLNAVRVASSIAAVRGAELEVVTVVGPRADADFERDRLAGQLRLIADELPVQPSAVAIRGEYVSAALIDHVTRVPTMVVMSSTGHGRSAAVVGSVAEDLLGTDVAALVVVGPHVVPGTPHLGDIIVPVNGSPLSESALAVAEAWCDGTKAGVWVVTVLATVAGAQVDSDVLESSYVAGVADRLRHHVAGRVDHEVLHGGSPARALADFAEEVDAELIVISTHGRSGLRRMVLGSVAGELIRCAPCPVLVHRLPPGAEVAP